MECKHTPTTSIAITYDSVKLLDKIVASGHSPSRSELIRRIIDKYLWEYYNLTKIFEILTPEQIKLIGD